MGHGTRSDRAAAEVVADYFGVECVGLELADPSFYHLDTAFCALPTGDVIYFRKPSPPGAWRHRGARRANAAHRARSRRGGTVLGKRRVLRSLPGAVELHRHAARED